MDAVEVMRPSALKTPDLRNELDHERIFCSDVLRPMDANFLAKARKANARARLRLTSTMQSMFSSERYP